MTSHDLALRFFKKFGNYRKALYFRAGKEGNSLNKKLKLNFFGEKSGCVSTGGGGGVSPSVVFVMKMC
jgi:hypothetical protein